MKPLPWLALAGLMLAGPSLTAADAPSLELKQTIVLKGKAGKLDHLALDAKRDRLFLANSVNGTLDVVDLKAGKLLKQVAGQTGIQGVAYAADLDKVFVGLGSGGLCNAFQGEDYKLLKTVKFADSDNVRYDPASHLVFVAHAENVLGVLDAKTFAVSPDIKLPGAAEGFQIATGKPLLYLVIPSPSQLVVIDTGKKEVVTTYPINAASNGHPLALDEANRRVFIGCRKEPMLVVMNMDTGKEVTSVALPKDVDDVYYDAKRKKLYAACGEGVLAVIKQVDADKYEVTEKIETAKQAKTAMFDAETGRLFLAVPRTPEREAPEIRVYQVRD
jgi:DNA-binding beta-propeller fold protein YncE